MYRGLIDLWVWSQEGGYRPSDEIE